MPMNSPTYLAGLNDRSAAPHPLEPAGGGNVDPRLIELVYEAPTDPEPWTALLHYFRNQVNASSVLMSFRLPWDDGENIDIDDSEWHSRTIRELYYKKYCAQNPMDYEAMEPGSIYSFEDFLTRAELLKTSYYRDFCQPQGIDYAFAVYLGDHNGLRTWLSCSRDERKGEFTSVELAYARAMIPHLQRALNIYSLLEQYKSGKRIYSNTIDSMKIGSVLLDRAGVIIEKNSSAQTIVSAGVCVAEADRQLVFASRSDQLRYEHLLGKLLNGDAAVDYESMVAGDDSERRVSVLIRKLYDQAGDGFANAPAAIVYLKRPMQEQAIAATKLVSSLFGLTRTEARLAVMLANGQTLDEIHTALGVTEQTVRTYCKRVFAKTGTNRQAELVRLILTSLANLV